MAIDPSISLAVRPPVIPPLQIQTPLEKFAKIQTLRNLMTEGQSGQLGLQTKQLQFQEAQKQVEDDAKLRQAYANDPNLRDADIISTIGPTRAIPLIKSRYEQLEQTYKTGRERAALLGSLAGSATDKDSAIRAVMQGVSLRAFSTDETQNSQIGRQLLDHLNTNGFDPAEFKQYQFEAMKAVEQHTAGLADAEEKRKAALAPFELSEKQSKAEQGALQTAGQKAQLLSDATQIPDFIAKLPPDLQQRFKNLSALPLDEFKRYAGLAAGAPKPGETIPLPADVQTQKVEQQAALGSAAEMAKLAIQRGDNAALVKTVIADSTGTIYAGLPPEIQRQIAPELGRQGFTKFEAKPTAAQDTAAAYAARVKQANPVLEQVVQSLGERAWNSLAPAEFLKTEQGQVFQQAERNFINAVLRRESGAVISPSEFAEARRQYIPQANESQAVLNQKRDNRLIAQQALIHAAGTAYRDPEQLLKEAGAPAAPAAASSGTGEAPAGSTPGLEVSKPGAEPKMVWIGPDGNKYYKPPPVKQQGAPPAKQQGAQAKTATVDQVKAYAKKHNISEAEARKAAEAEGFVIR